MGVSVYSVNKAVLYSTGWMDSFMSDEEIDDAWERGLRQVFAYEGFHNSTRGFPGHDVVSKRDFIAENVYDISTGERMEVVSMSYGGYGAFRKTVGDLVGLNVKEQEVWKNIDTYKDMPFFEFVWFADNEGAIGPEACADLAADFELHEPFYVERWKGKDSLGDYYVNHYRSMMDGFRHAAGEGFVYLS